MKGKPYKTVVSPAVSNGLQTVALTGKQEMELEVAELRMLRFSLGVTRLDRLSTLEGQHLFGVSNKK